MKVRFRKSFARDLKKIKDRSLLTRVRTAVEFVRRLHQRDIYRYFP